MAASSRPGSALRWVCRLLVEAVGQADDQHLVVTGGADVHALPEGALARSPAQLALTALVVRPGADGKDAHLDTYLRSEKVQIPAGNKAVGDATCAAGDVVTGGGYSSNDHTNGWAKIYQNRMTWVNTGNENTHDAWHVEALGGDRDADVYVWALCVLHAVFPACVPPPAARIPGVLQPRI